MNIKEIENELEEARKHYGEVFKKFAETPVYRSGSSDLRNEYSGDYIKAFNRLQSAKKTAKGAGL